MSYSLKSNGTVKELVTKSDLAWKSGQITRDETNNPFIDISVEKFDNLVMVFFATTGKTLNANYSYRVGVIGEGFRTRRTVMVPVAQAHNHAGNISIAANGEVIFYCSRAITSGMNLYAHSFYRAA